MEDMEHLLPVFHEHKTIFTGETYDYLFSYALHWHELRCLAGSLGEFAGTRQDAGVHQVIQQTQRCVKLLEKDFSALIRDLTNKYIRRPCKESEPTLTRENSSGNENRGTRPKPIGLSLQYRNLMGGSSSECFAGLTPPSNDLKVQSQMFSDSVELAKLDGTCFMRDSTSSAQEQGLMDAWAHEFPHRVVLDASTEKKAKQLVRRGIPHTLRQELWTLTTGASKLMVERPKLYRHAIRDTFPCAEEAVNSPVTNFFSRLSNIDPSKVPLFGGKLPFQEIPLNEHGMHQTKILLCALAQNTHVDYCPTLPTIVSALLMYMPEAKAYATAKCLLSGSAAAYAHCELEDPAALLYRYIPTTEGQSLLCSGILMALVKKKLPSVAKQAERLGVDLESCVQHWFNSIFSEVLPLAQLLEVLDCLFLEGAKISQRVALALLKLCEKDILKAASKEEVEDILHVKVRHLPDLQNVVKVAFSFQLRRKEIEDLEQALRPTIRVEPRALPMRDGLYYRPTIQTKSRIITREEHWETLFYWLTDHPGVPAAPWRLAFSTWRDGSSLKSLYHACSHIGANITIVKALPHHADMSGSWNWGLEIFGVFSSEPPRVTNEYYGNGTCFTFRLSQRPQRWNWVHKDPPDRNSSTEAGSEAEPPAYENNMFICGHTDHLVFGGGGDGPALDLQGDLQTATTYQSGTYKNHPLCSAPLFDIQHVEVYCFEE